MGSSIHPNLALDLRSECAVKFCELIFLIACAFHSVLGLGFKSSPYSTTCQRAPVLPRLVRTTSSSALLPIVTLVSLKRQIKGLEEMVRGQSMLETSYRLDLVIPEWMSQMPRVWRSFFLSAT